MKLIVSTLFESCYMTMMLFLGYLFMAMFLPLMSASFGFVHLPGDVKEAGVILGIMFGSMYVIKLLLHLCKHDYVDMAPTASYCPTHRKHI